MSLDTYALTTYQNVLDLLGVDKHPQPSVIEAMINTASRQIIQDTGREFKPLYTGTTRTFPITPSGLVVLTPGEVRNVTLFRANVEGTSPTTLVATDYEAFNWTGGGTRAFQLFSNYSFPRDPITGLVEVTGTWGWASVPSDVEWACRWQVSQWVRRDLQSRSNQLSTGSEDPAVVTPYINLAPSVRRALSYYRSHPVVA